MKTKPLILFFVCAATIFSADMQLNKSLLKNRANIAEDNGGMYGNKIYIYKDAVETQREINSQSRYRNDTIEIASPTIDKHSKARSVEVLVEGGNLNIIGRRADVNIAAPKIQSGSLVKEIRTTTNINNINILANQNSNINIATPQVSNGNQLRVIGANNNIININTAANKNTAVSIGSVDASRASAVELKSLTTETTVNGNINLHNSTTLNVGSITTGLYDRQLP